LTLAAIYAHGKIQRVDPEKALAALVTQDKLVENIWKLEERSAADDVAVAVKNIRECCQDDLLLAAWFMKKVEGGFGAKVKKIAVKPLIRMKKAILGEK